MKTGIWLARRPSSDSWIDASSVSAPSVTITRPASGRPVNSSFARCSASPSLVCVPSNDRSRGGADAIGGGREAEDAHGVAAGQRLHHRAVGCERRVDELAPRLAVVIGHAHAAGVVQQDAEEVLLRHGRPQNQDRPEQAEEDEADKAETRSAMSTARSSRLASPGAVR